MYLETRVFLKITVFMNQSQLMFDVFMYLCHVDVCVDETLLCCFDLKSCLVLQRVCSFVCFSTKHFTTLSISQCDTKLSVTFVCDDFAEWAFTFCK